MDTENRVYQICLQAFTEIFAITSHELKNTLAIINENSGLLDDLVMMSGDNVESKRVQIATSAIEKQINRSDKIIKTMNRFAHSADLTITTVPVKQMLTDLVDLTARKAAGAEVIVQVDCDDSTTVTGELPAIEATIYYILSAVYSSDIKPESNTLFLKSTQSDSRLEILFDLPDSNLVLSEKAKQQLNVLSDYLNASINSAESTIKLSL